MAFGTKKILENIKLLIPAFIVMLIVFAGIGYSLYLDRQTDRRTAAQIKAEKSGDSTVTIDGAFTATLPCPEPEGPQVGSQDGARVTTYSCAIVKSDGRLDKVFFASNKTYGSATTLTPGVDYAFCGTYTNGSTSEVMSNRSNIEKRVNNRMFRICEYVGDKGTQLHTAKTVSADSLQTFTIFGPAAHMKDIDSKFTGYVESLRFNR